MWLSIKRQSQVERIVFVDIEIENSIFYELLQQEPQVSEQCTTENK